MMGERDEVKMKQMVSERPEVLDAALYGGLRLPTGQRTEGLSKLQRLEDLEVSVRPLEGMCVCVCGGAGEAEDDEWGLVLKAVRQCPRMLLHLPEALQSDTDVALAAVQTHGRALDFLPNEALRNDRRFVLAAAGQCGLVLAHLPEAFRHDGEIVLAAVQQDGGALRHVP